jgi:hypothetical protein
VLVTNGNFFGKISANGDLFFKLVKILSFFEFFSHQISLKILLKRNLLDSILNLQRVAKNIEGC